MAILAECPTCRRRQSLRNKICSCGENLDRAKKSKKIEYWITYRLPGGKQRFEKVGNSLELAKDAESKRRVQKREKRFFEILPETNMTFRELTNWYLGLESTKSKKYFWVLKISLETFNKMFGDKLLSDIKTSEIEDYKAWRERVFKVSLATIKREIIAAKTVINAAFKDGMISGEVLRVFKNVKVSGGSEMRTRVLSPAEFQAIEDASSPKLKPILRIGYETGLRLSEILKMRWGRLNLKDRIISLKPEDTKTKKGRMIPMSDEVFSIFSRMPRPLNDDNLVFNVTKKIISWGLSRACERAGLVYGRFRNGGLIFHDLRRTFYTDLRRAGVQEGVIMTLTGHSRNRVIDRYNVITIEDLRDAIKKLSDYRKACENVDQNVDQARINFN